MEDAFGMIVLILAYFLFAGEPDIHDLVIRNLSGEQVERCSETPLKTKQKEVKQ